MTISKNDYLFHFIAYYLAWFGAILLAAKQESLYAIAVVIIPVTCQLIWQYKVAKRTQGLWQMMALFFLLGTCTDTFLMQSGMIEFAANPFNTDISAPWMSALWLSFAITFYSRLPSFFECYILDGILALFSFPIAYAAGAALHAAYLPHGYISAIVVGLIWAILFPLVLKYYHIIQR